MTYLALGDSYTIGEGVGGGERWPAVWAARRAWDAPVIVARTGWTTDELAAGIAAAQLAERYDHVSLLIGVNDQYRGRPVAAFRPAYASLLARALRFAGDDAPRLLALSIPDWGVTPFAADRGRARIAAEIDAYNAEARAQVEAAGARWVDITDLTRAHPDELAADGLHPSARQYARWVERIEASV